MINFGSTNLGEIIRALREAKGMTRMELSEAVGISESHLKKIETGIRQPGINTYKRIVETLGLGIVIKSEEETLKGNCIAKAQEILLNSSDYQALFMIRLLEFIAQNLNYPQ